MADKGFFALTMEGFAALDERILGGVERASHCLQRNFGIGNFFVAKLGIALAAISVMLGVVNYFHRMLPEPSSVGLVVIGPLLLLMFVLRSWMCTDAESGRFSGSGTRTVHPLLQSRPAERVFWLWLAAGDSLVYLTVRRNGFLDFCNGPLFEIGLAVFYYFVAVMPLPPGTSRVREWFASFGKVLVPARQRR